VLRPVEHCGVAAAEGRDAARAILHALGGRLPPLERASPLVAQGGLRYVYPQRIIPDERPVQLYGRARTAWNGYLRLVADGEVLAEQRVITLPERRLCITVPGERLRGRTGLQAVLQ
jgi:hypothetical protein